MALKCITHGAQTPPCLTLPLAARCNAAHASPQAAQGRSAARALQRRLRRGGHVGCHLVLRAPRVDGGPPALAQRLKLRCNLSRTERAFSETARMCVAALRCYGAPLSGSRGARSAPRRTRRAAPQPLAPASAAAPRRAQADRGQAPATQATSVNPSPKQTRKPSSKTHLAPLQVETGQRLGRSEGHAAVGVAVHHQRRAGAQRRLHQRAARHATQRQPAKTQAPPALRLRTARAHRFSHRLAEKSRCTAASSSSDCDLR